MVYALSALVETTNILTADPYILTTDPLPPPPTMINILIFNPILEQWDTPPPLQQPQQPVH